MALPNAIASIIVVEVGVSSRVGVPKQGVVLGLHRSARGHLLGELDLLLPKV